MKYLALNSYFTIQGMAKNLNVAFTTVQRAIEKLLHLEVIQEISHNKRNRVYCAVAILRILEEPTDNTKAE